MHSLSIILPCTSLVPRPGENGPGNEAMFIHCWQKLWSHSEDDCDWKIRFWSPTQDLLSFNFYKLRYSLSNLGYTFMYITYRQLFPTTPSPFILHHFQLAWGVSLYNCSVFVAASWPTDFLPRNCLWLCGTTVNRLHVFALSLWAFPTTTIPPIPSGLVINRIPKIMKNQHDITSSNGNQSWLWTMALR